MLALLCSVQRVGCTRPPSLYLLDLETSEQLFEANAIQGPIKGKF